ncbi:MAG TPA: cysteine desulfurase family protein [Gemmatimonadota bacterium]|nr:cysteine desulfurase family protein [Gemmatimonadota bacterium]
MSESPTGRAGAYLDHAATSPLRAEVWRAMEAALGEADYNPASPHGFGSAASSRLEEARRTLASLLGAPRAAVHFTSGGTAADNLAVLGFARAYREREPVLLVSAVEHKAVLESARRAEREGARLEVIPVDGSGRVRLGTLEGALSRAAGVPCLVSLMWANNEVGTVQPVAEAARLAHEHGAILHTDAVQAFGKVPVSFADAGADLLTVTAHKLGGPVGIGALVVREGTDLEPITFGGSQERGLWPGTQSPLAAVGFAEAARLAVEALPGSAERWRVLRDRLASAIADALPDARIHGEDAPERLPNLVSVGLPGVDSAELLVSLDLEGIAASSGSACSSGSQELSHVLAAMGIELPEAEPYAVLRFSLGPSTTEEEVERAGRVAARIARRLDSRTPARGA